MRLAVAAVVVGLLGCGGEPARSPAARARAERAFDAYRRPDLILAALGLRGGERVVDVGAGRGYLTLPIARAVGPRGRVLATDVDEAALAELRSRAAGQGGGAPIETRSVAPDDPGLGDERFDLVLLSEVDHLLPDRAAYLARLRRHLTPTGRLVVCNRRPDRPALVAAAAEAGLVPRGEMDRLPGHFLLFFGADR